MSLDAAVTPDTELVRKILDQQRILWQLCATLGRE